MKYLCNSNILTLEVFLELEGIEASVVAIV
ncbi:unnamed protein product [Spirodela intermedia]|uniref:Uncharacterized protein n=2 Tax=Spirodela intermedia TaxID=51605 RepID=A0A7I8JNF6_SPIIN|nr:unnamed protein product [Spirodela intermedia]CAA6671620.1 unnamed protein product [Spirodela intermedia]CAA7408722.1 unnamed protein product [Spirodela intermedia]